MTTALEINVTSIYDDAGLRLGLGVTSSTLARARRDGSLRFVRRGHTNFYTGRAVLDWLTSTEAKEDQAVA